MQYSEHMVKFSNYYWSSKQDGILETNELIKKTEKSPSSQSLPKTTIQNMGLLLGYFYYLYSPFDNNLAFYISIS